MSRGSSHTGDCYSSQNTLGSTLHPRRTVEMVDFFSDVRVPMPRLVTVVSISPLLCCPTQSISRLSFCTDHSKKRRSRISAFHTSEARGGRSTGEGCCDGGGGSLDFALVLRACMPGPSSMPRF